MIALPIFRWIPALALAGALAACGTSYDLPESADSATSRAAAIFAEARTAPRAGPSSVATGEARFARVARRIEPVARQFCLQEFQDRTPIDCNVRLEIDRQMKERNAYFTYTKQGFEGPVIRFTVPMLQDAQSDDEVAFILGHEYGHLIGQHIVKQQQQALAGALLLGAITAIGNAGAGVNDPGSIDRSIEIGAAIGQRAYSQTYELESDMLGTRIARSAGYDPIEGAKFFARAEAANGRSGLTFWGTHPPDVKRMEVVIATTQAIDGS